MLRERPTQNQGPSPPRGGWSRWIKPSTSRAILLQTSASPRENAPENLTMAPLLRSPFTFRLAHVLLRACGPTATLECELRRSQQPGKPIEDTRVGVFLHLQTWHGRTLAFCISAPPIPTAILVLAPPTGFCDTSVSNKDLTSLSTLCRSGLGSDSRWFASCFAPCLCNS